MLTSGGREVSDFRRLFYLRHLERHLLSITLEDVSQYAQGPLSWYHILLLHLGPGGLRLAPVVCVL